MKQALKLLKQLKASSEDDITNELLIAGGSAGAKELRLILNEALFTGEIPNRWINSIVVLFQKK